MNRIHYFSAMSIAMLLGVQSPTAGATNHCATYNTPPGTSNLGFRMQQDTTFLWRPGGWDFEHDPVVCSLVTAPTNGTATISTYCLSGTYTPNAGFLGMDSFTYKATDSCGADSQPASVVATVIAPCSGAGCYRVIGLGSPSDSFTGSGDNINNSGYVIGRADQGVDFLWDPTTGTMMSIGDIAGFPTASSGIAADINDLGQIVGWYGSVPWLYDLNSDVLTFFGALKDGRFYTINNRGRIAAARPAAGGTEIFTWDLNTQTTVSLGVFGRYSGPSDINDSYQITGTLNTASGYEGFFWDPQAGLVTLSGFPNNLGYTFPNAINAKGQVVGRSAISYYNYEAFIWDPTTRVMQGLGGLASNFIDSEARDINIRGQVVGSSASFYSYSLYGEAFIWDSTRGMLGLFTLLDTSGAGWVLFSADAINDKGQITGHGLNPQGESQGFLLTCADVCADVSDPCLAQYPVSQFSQTGKQGTITISFTGNIVSQTNKAVKVCFGTSLSYMATSTMGPVVCKLNNNTTRSTGTLRIDDYLKCTDKPAGKDKVHFKVKSGVVK